MHKSLIVLSPVSILFFLLSNRCPYLPGYMAKQNRGYTFSLPCNQQWPHDVEVSCDNYLEPPLNNSWPVLFVPFVLFLCPTRYRAKKATLIHELTLTIRPCTRDQQDRSKEFTGSPVVRTPHLHFPGPRFDPWWEN